MSGAIAHNHQIWLWIAFGLIVAGMLYVDLFLANRKRHAVGMKEAAVWCGVWVAVSLLFCGGVYFYLSPEKAVQFLTGYLIEQSLSVDNMFVFILIFAYFKIPPHDQPRVLKWGILGAVAMRFLFIFLGAALLDKFHWLIYVFGAFLIYTAYGMAFGGEKEFNPAVHPVFKRVMRLRMTPILLTILVVEASDLVFALDSIPAIFAVTRDRFIVYTSNIFAILGLRSLYFLLAGLVQAFTYLKYGVALILAFVGAKMLLDRFLPIPTLLSLGVIVALLAGSVGASLLLRPKKKGVLSARPGGFT